MTPIPQIDMARFLSDTEQDYRRSVLNEKLGFKIPEEVMTFIDKDYQSWPALYVKVRETAPGNGQYLVVAMKDGLLQSNSYGSTDEVIDIFRDWKQKEIEIKKIAADAPAENTPSTVSIPESLGDCDVIVRLPFWDFYHDDDNFKIEFEGKDEVFLTSCS